nr:C39 family peptidase [Chloroflexota bacterium]
MAILHMQTEEIRNLAAKMRHTAKMAEGELFSLHRALDALSCAWQGGGHAKFQAEAEHLATKLSEQITTLFELSIHLEHEVAEWEETDQRGARYWTASRTAMPFKQTPLITGGVSGLFLSTAFLSSGFSPPLILAELPWSRLLPPWLRTWLEKLFPSQEIHTPIAEETPPSLPKSSFRELITEKPDQPTSNEPSASVSAQPASSTSKYEIYHEVPVHSQGSLYGNAACAPASVSMVLDYFHAIDPSHKTVSPDELIKMLDPGDGIPGKGISLSKVTDELQQLGYQIPISKVNASLKELRTALQDGPVIIAAGVNLVGGKERALKGAGNTMHSMVVKGMAQEGQLVVNDPWSGKEVQIDPDTFEEMWEKGMNSMYVIRP